MKKLVVLTTLLTTLSIPAFAKTEGDYVSLSVLYNKMDLTQKYVSDTPSHGTTSSAGMGIGYRHAFSFDKFFVAPGVFAEKNNVKSTINNTNIDIKNRYGFKADVGFDIEDDLAIYLVGGLSFFNYKMEDQGDSKSGRAKADFFYGVGISHDYSKNTSFSLEYNTQSLTLKGADTNKVSIDNNTVKIGLSYKF